MQNWACCYKGDIVGIVYLQNLMIDCCGVAQSAEVDLTQISFLLLKRR